MDELIPRHLTPVAQQMLKTFPGIVIEGARQVGKSTLARQLAPDSHVANLDNAAIRSVAQADPTLLFEHGGTTIIDEIQHVPELTLAIKASIDEDRRPGRFIITGSSSLLRVRGLSDSMVGRVGRLSLYGFSRGETHGQRDDFADAVAAIRETQQPVQDFTTATTRQDYADLLETGNYPDVIAHDGRTRRQWLDSYLEGLVYRDLPELRSHYDPTRAMAVLRVLTSNPAGELVVAHVSRDTRIPASTVGTYLDLWRSVGLITTLPPWTANLGKRETGRAKVITLDSGLGLRVARVSSAQLLALENLESFGNFLESMVDAELIRQQTWSNQDYEVFHFRDRDGWEVDTILELADGGVIGIEVKAATSFRGDQFNGLRRLRDKLGARFVAGFVLNTGQRGYHYADRLYGLPVAALWEWH